MELFPLGAVKRPLGPVECKDRAWVGLYFTVSTQQKDRLTHDELVCNELRMLSYSSSRGSVQGICLV
jgi:hypothetical protein